MTDWAGIAALIGVVGLVILHAFDLPEHRCIVPPLSKVFRR